MPIPGQFTLPPFQNVPDDPALSHNTKQFLSWLQNAVLSLQGDGTPLPAPTVTLKSVPGGLQITWTEVFGADRYQIWVNTTADKPASPTAVVPANKSAVGTNSYVISGLTDTNPRYVRVTPLNPQGIPGGDSPLVSASATAMLAAPITTGDIADNAVSVDGLFSNDSGGSVPTSETSVGSVTLTTDGGVGEVWAKLQIASPGTTGTYTYNLTLRKDSVTGPVLDFSSVKLPQSQRVVIPVMGLDFAPASSQTYVLTLYTTTGTPLSSYVFVRLLATNKKK